MRRCSDPDLYCGTWILGLLRLAVRDRLPARQHQILHVIRACLENQGEGDSSCSAARGHRTSIIPPPIVKSFCARSLGRLDYGITTSTPDRAPTPCFSQRSQLGHGNSARSSCQGTACAKHGVGTVKQQKLSVKGRPINRGIICKSLASLCMV